MGIKFYIFALVALGLSSRARATEDPVCACVVDDAGGCDGDDAACECDGTLKCTITVLPADGQDPSALECDGASCVCDVSVSTAPSCSGGPKLATGASSDSVDYTVLTDGTASCQFTLNGLDASDFQCTTLATADVVQMGTLFSCSGVAISTADDEGCVFVKGVSVKCEDSKECTVASIDNDAFKCEGLQCFIRTEGTDTKVSSEGGDAVVSVSDSVGCTNPASSGDCECDLTAASCKSSVDDAVVKGGGDTCTVGTDASTCTCDATGCGGDDVAKCTCEPLVGDLAAACDGDDTACACKQDGDCKVSVSQGDNATGLTCSGKTCSCSLPSGPDGGAASCSVEVSGGSITSGLTDAELTVVVTADSTTAICELTISSSEVRSPVCLGGDTDTISNKHFTCSGVAFDTAAPTGCNMTDADRAACVGDDSCKIESIDVDEAECNGVKCEAHFATLVTMSSTGGEALVSASSIVHCTNPTDEGTCRCTADADLGVYICSSESDDGSVSGGSTGTEKCENSSCSGCPGATFCKCTAAACDLCTCNGEPSDGPTGQPSDGPTGQPSDGPTGQPSDGPTDMGSTDDTETTTRGLPSSATQSALNVGLMAVVAVGGIALR